MTNASQHPLLPARVGHPGRIIRRELDARGWTQIDLAETMCLPQQAISEIVNGEMPITPDIALSLAQALGTSAELWLNLESAWQLSKARRQ